MYIYIDIFASVGAISKMCKIDECADATGYAGGKAIKSGVSDICRCLDNLSAGKTGFIISALSQHRHPCTDVYITYMYNFSARNCIVYISYDVKIIHIFSLRNYLFVHVLDNII